MKHCLIGCVFVRVWVFSIPRSRKRIREAKLQQEHEINERISNWRDKNGKQTISRAEVSRHNKSVSVCVCFFVLYILRKPDVYICAYAIVHAHSSICASRSG